jgi:LDH2 family malate/lactate/ureidoglycolate dehydrogenase
MNQRVEHQQLKEFTKAVFVGVGMSACDADLLASHLVAANLRGVDSHGVVRVGIYTERMMNGLVNINTEIEVTQDAANYALLDGKNSQGILVAQRAIELAVKKAKQTGIAAVGVNQSNHFGMLAYYGRYAVEHDCIAMITSNASPSMAPWGGKDPFFGTNPLCYGIPAGEEIPLIGDMAMSVVARGKIRLAIRNNQSIPTEWAITKDGRPTSDPGEALTGTVLPMGGAKGYGLVTFIEVLSAIFTGAEFGPYAGPITGDRPQGLGHFFLVVKADLFQPLASFKHRMDQMIREIRNVSKMEGIERIYLPGELELERETERKQQGIPLPTHVFEELAQIGKNLNVHIDDYIQR